jgi:hypothetical protein
VLELALLCGFDAATLAVAPALLAGWRGEGWRRAIEVFIFVVLEGLLDARSFTSTRFTLRG